MKYITKQEYDSRLQKIHKENESMERRQQLREERRKFKPSFKLTTTKKIVFLLFANFFLVEFFSMIAMWHFGNLDALYVLITTVLAEPITLAVYAAKSYNETKQEEIIRLERDKLELDEEKPVG